jgi:hypothetical protein
MLGYRTSCDERLQVLSFIESAGRFTVKVTRVAITPQPSAWPDEKVLFTPPSG